MMPSIFITLCFFIISIVGLASSAPIFAARDVYIPHITSPHKGTVWECGEHATVSWDKSNLPKEVTNPVGKVVLRKQGLEDLANPLAEGFSVVNKTSVSFKVPKVPTRNDYQIVLFGDSGNFSPDFTIKCESD